MKIVLPALMAGAAISIASIQASAADTWTFCAKEWGTCSFSGTAQVRYGANGKYFTETFTGGTPCTNAVFGDPIFGVVKSCEYLPPTTTTTPTPTPTPTAGTWTFCAKEWGTCSFSGTAQVRYGANGTYFTKTLTTSTPCTNNAFGDPLPGTVKKCEYLSGAAAPAGTSGGSTGGTSGTTSGGTSGGITGGTTIVSEAFEGSSIDRNLWQFNKAPSSMPDFALSSNYARSGSQSGYVRVPPNTAGDIKRSSINVQQLPHYFHNGTEYCFTVSMRPTNWTSIPSWSVNLDLHGSPGDGNWSCPAVRGPIQIGSMKNDNSLGLYAVTDPWSDSAPSGWQGGTFGNFVASVPNAMNNWTDWIVRFKPQTPRDSVQGILEVWANGKKLYSKFGPNADYRGWANCAPAAPYWFFKIGQYSGGNTGTQEIYFDNIKIVKNPTTCGPSM